MPRFGRNFKSFDKGSIFIGNNFADFGMTIAFAQFVQRTSGVAYSLLSVAKDVGIVVVRYKSFI